MDVCTNWYYGDRKVSVLLQEHLFADLAYSQGEHGQHRKFQHIYSGGAQPFALDDKGGE